MNELIMPHNAGVKRVLESMKEVLALYKNVTGNYRPLLDGERYLTPLYRLNVLEGCIELVAQHCQVIVEFLARYLGVDLSRNDVRMSQDTAHAFDGHTF